MKKITLITSVLLLLLFSCQKGVEKQSSQEEIQTAANQNRGHLKQTKEYPSDVALRWLNMELDMLRVPMPTGVAAPEANRAIAYCGIALYEAVEPGMPAYQTLSGQLNALTGIRTTEPGFAYHWAACANAALAYINKHLFPLASAANKTAMDNFIHNFFSFCCFR